MSKFYVCSSSFHADTFDSRKIISRHRSIEAAKKAALKEHKRHSEECKCSGPIILSSNDGREINEGTRLELHGGLFDERHNSDFFSYK